MRDKCLVLWKMICSFHKSFGSCTDTCEFCAVEIQPHAEDQHNAFTANKVLKMGLKQSIGFILVSTEFHPGRIVDGLGMSAKSVCRGGNAHLIGLPI